MNQNDRLDPQTTDCDDDNSTAQDREIERLLEIIDREIEKPDEEIDYDLIEECTARLDALTPLERPYTDEEIEKNLQKLKDDIRKAEESAKIRSAPAVNRWNRPWIKAMAAIAACFVVCFSTLSIVAKNQGYGNTWEFVVTNARKIVGMDPGEQANNNEITIIKPSGEKAYNSIDELIEQENLHILYPTKLPDNLTIKKIVQTFEDEEKYSLYFVFSDSSYFYKICNYMTSTENFSDNENLYEVKGAKFHITEKNNNIFYAVTQYNGFEYSIQCNDYDNLMNILDNLKGF